MAEARIDKWLWASRIFKTRTIAAEACKKGRVSINGTQVKPSRMIKPGEVIQVKKPPVTYSFKVLQAIEKRIGAKLVPEILENVTTPEQYELLEMSFHLNKQSVISAARNREKQIWNTRLHSHRLEPCSFDLAALAAVRDMKQQRQLGVSAAFELRPANKYHLFVIFYVLHLYPQNV